MEMIEAWDVVVLLAGLGVLLAAARFFGEIALYFKLPVVFGEILAGILLGPTVLGAIAPDVNQFLFPQAGTAALLQNGVFTLSIVLFLLVAGLEADIGAMWRQGRNVFSIGLSGIIVPAAIAFGLAWHFPYWLGYRPDADPVIFAIFMATALSVSALPVIARNLMDLDLYHSDMGMMIVGAAIFNDLLGWIAFAIILGLLGAGGENAMGLGGTIVLTLGFTLVMLTVVRWCFHRLLPWIQAHASWPGGQLGLVLSLTLLGAAFTEWIGVHAIFGAFIVGVAMGDTPHFRETLRSVIDRFASFFFAPLFFASIGLKLDFAAAFDPVLTVVVILVASVGKVLGCHIGARIAGMSKREAWAVGFGMNARVALEIILGLMALRFGLITEALFVALVFMAIITSLTSGLFMQKIMRLKKPRRFTAFVPQRGFVKITGNTPEQAIGCLARAAAPIAGLDAGEITESVLKREALMPTGIGSEMAVPHARLAYLSAPMVCVGTSTGGIDFKGPDGLAARLFFLVLTPVHDNGAQVEILADIARTFRNEALRRAAINASNATEFCAVVKTVEQS